MSTCIEEKAIVTLIASKSEIPESTKKLIGNGHLAWFNRDYEPRDFDGKSVIINLSNNPLVKQVATSNNVMYFEASELVLKSAT